MSNNAKKTWNTQKTPTKHVLRLFKNFLKIWFSAQKSGSRLRCRTMLKKNILKHPENTNKTCFEAFWEILENPVLGSKIRFSAQMLNNAKMPWSIQKTPPKHVKRLLKMFWKHCSRLKNPVLGSDVEQWKKHETPRKHQLNMFWGFSRISWKSGSRLKNLVLGSDVEQC